ncbi:MAG TPA: efflux RND transporter periplasmic adaptor subunit [Burkholderiaceae bacterium]|nr:efflux RND transporter periplasmic adaptor subunit [Burkholderiaceae bacterium]
MKLKSRSLAPALLAGTWVACVAWAAEPAPPVPLAAVTVARAGQGAQSAYDGVVEALRQTTVAAQVSAAVVELKAKVGDRVVAGQVLMRLDARAADQNAAASGAQVRAARAAQDVAAKAFERQRQLAADRFISAAALDRAEAEFKAAQAQAAAQVAQAGAARTASGHYVVRAPYAGVVSEVPVTLGDMALPGRALVTLFDPLALRVAAAVPQSAAASVGDGKAVRVEVPALPSTAQRMQTPLRVQVLPAADLATHTVTLRADLAPGLAGAMPGQFARLWLPAADGLRAGSPWVPAPAIVRRAEMTGLYVLDANGKPLLRQVRLGRSDGVQVEVLSGLAPGERVATDAQVAARMTASVK